MPIVEALFHVGPVHATPTADAAAIQAAVPTAAITASPAPEAETVEVPADDPADPAAPVAVPVPAAVPTVGGGTAITTAEFRAFEVSTPAVPTFSELVAFCRNATAASVCPTVLLSVVFESLRSP